MKRLRACISAVTATMFLVAACRAGDQAHGCGSKLADRVGSSHAMYPWIKQVEVAGKGRIKIEVFPSQTLIKGIDMWKGVRGGIADIGWCVQGYWPEQTPLSDVMSLPFLPIKSAEKSSEALWKLMRNFRRSRKRVF